MKNTGIILLGVAGGLVAAVIAYALLSGAQQQQHLTDDELIGETRTAATANPSSEVITAPYASSQASSTSAPLIELATDHHQMGTISNMETAHDTIMVYNRGNSPLHISRVTTSCGCTQGKMPDGKEIIPAGGEVAMEVTVDPFRIPAFHSTKVLTVYSNDPDNPTALVKVSAEVDPEVEVEPTSLSFGTIDKGETPELKYVVRQLSDEPLEITDQRLAGVSDAIDLTYEKLPPSKWRTPGKVEYEVSVKIRPSAPTGALRVTAMLATNLKRLKNLPPLVIDGNVDGLYNLNARAVTLRGVEPGETREAVLTVTAPPGIELEEIQAPNSMLIPSQRRGEDPNTIVIDVAVAENPDKRWQRDTWTLKLKSGERVFSEDVRVMAIINMAVDAETANAAGAQTESQ